MDTTDTFTGVLTFDYELCSNVIQTTCGIGLGVVEVDNINPVVSPIDLIPDVNGVIEIDNSTFTGAFSDSNGDALREVELTNMNLDEGSLLVNNQPVNGDISIDLTQPVTIEYTPNDITESSEDGFDWQGFDGAQFSNTERIMLTNTVNTESNDGNDGNSQDEPISTNYTSTLIRTGGKD